VTTESEAAKAVLHRYLVRAREALLWKLDDLSEYDARRPIVRTGTNLLGLVKHMALNEGEYLGLVFDRPMAELAGAFPDDADPNADMWAAAEESLLSIADLYRRVWVHADATIEALDLESQGLVPWWPEDRRSPTLHAVLVHVIAETNRHAGHADILREIIDGSAGMSAQLSNLPDVDEDYWPDYAQRLESLARQFEGR